MSALEANLAKAEQYLARFRKDGVQNQIGGAAVPACDGTSFETISPVDLKPLAENRARQGPRHRPRGQGGEAGISRMGCARRQQTQRRSCTKSPTRSSHAPKRSLSSSAWTPGRRCKFMAKAALRGAENFRFYADRAPEARDGRMLRTDGQLNMTTRVPIGPVGIITPWNTPFMLSTWKIAPALAAGCTVVHKPAEFSPLTARLLVEIAEEAGLPAGRLEPRQRYRRRRRQGADRASGHQGDRALSVKAAPAR